MLTLIRRHSRREMDAGLSMLEVVIAMAIFAIGVTAILGIFVNTGDVVGSNIRRSAAANLVNQSLEAARAQSAVAITNGRTVTTQAVGNITYTITQDASFLTSKSVLSVCADTGSTLAYKVVRISVTWPDMGEVQPVSGSVLRAVGVGDDGLKANTGTLAVLVTNALGNPVPGATVVVSGVTGPQTTGSDGCAVFAGLDPGSHSVNATKTGFISNLNSPGTPVAMGVAAGTVYRGTFPLDSERTLNYVFDSPAAGSAPAGMPIGLGSSSIQVAPVPTCGGNNTQICLTGVPGSLKHLYPAIWTVSAGSCAGSSSQGSIDNRSASADNGTVSVPMAAVMLKVRTNAGKFLDQKTISFIPAAANGCPSGATYTTQSVAAGSTIVLPYGSWTVSVPATSAPGAPPVNSTNLITVSPTARTADVTLVVAN